MSASQYSALFLAYSVALLAALGISWRAPRLWPSGAAPAFPHPWREVAWALVATAAVLSLGVLYSRGRLFPATSQHRPALDAINQIVIYAPFPLLLVLRRQGPETAWLPRRDIVLRVGIGLGLALLALIVYAVARFGLGVLPQLVAHVYAPSHVSYLVQVLLEDLSIAILFVRFRNVLGLRWTLLLVALLFAAARVPGLLARGEHTSDLWRLIGDVGLGVLGLALLQRLQDVWWFWMVHFALDMTQFYDLGTAA